MRGGRGCCAVALLVLSLAACTAGQPGGRTGTPTTATTTATTTEAPADPAAALTAGHDPDDPHAVLARALQGAREVRTGTVTETRTLSVPDAPAVTTTVTTRFDLDTRTVVVDHVVAVPDGTDVALRFALVDDEVLMAAPADWGRPDGTWYRLGGSGDVGSQWVLPQGLDVASPVIELLGSPSGNVFVLEGDATTSEVVYGFGSSGPQLAHLVAARLRQTVLDDVAGGGGHVEPTTVTVDQDGRLLSMTVEFTKTASSALADLHGTDSDNFGLTASATMTLTPGPAPVDVPDPEDALDASQMPSDPLDVVDG